MTESNELHLAEKSHGVTRKGWLESVAIRNILYLVLTPIVTQVVAALPAVEAKILDLSPTWLDPAVHPVIAGISLGLTAIFGLNAAKGVKKEAANAPTQIKGLGLKKKKK